MTRPIKALLRAVVLLPLLGILLLPTYALLLMLALGLPPLLTVLTFVDAKKRGELGDVRSIAGRLLLALIALPLGLVAVLAPIRSLLVGAFSFHPPALRAFNQPHEAFHALLVPVFGELAPYWLDFYWGILGVLTIFVFALVDSIRRNLLVSQIENLSTSKVRSVAVGLAELAGRAVPFAADAEARPIIRSWLKRGARGYSSQTRIDKFYLDDGTGRILVDATGAKVGSEADTFSVALHQVKLRQQEGDHGLMESRLMPGDRVFVLGTVQINDDAALKSTHPLVIKPRQSSLFRFNYYELFFLGNGNQESLLDAFKRSIGRGWSTVLALMGIAGWLSIYAWTNIIQTEALELEAAPQLFRLVSTPTVMERPLEVPGLGRRPAVDWLNLVEQESADKHLVLERLKEEGLARFAIPALLQSVRDIDHADFGVSNHWLMALDALPEGHWGYQFFSEDRAGQGDTMIFKVMLKRTGAGLFVSYDVYFNETQPINSLVSARKIVLVFKHPKSGSTQSAEIAAAPGWNRGREVEVFEAFASGEYLFQIYAKREFRGGLNDRAPWPVPELRIALSR